MDNNHIAKVIKDIRTSNKMTQAEFAEKLGVTFQAVSKWENGKNIPDISILKQISNGFNIDLIYILEGKEKVKNIKPKKIFIILSIIVIVGSLLFYFLFPDNSLKLKSLSTNSKDFEVGGCVVFNNELSSIYVSDINYLGENGSEIYKEISFILYEENNDKIIKIDEKYYDNKLNKKLKDLIVDVNFNVNNYKASCKTYENNKMYIKVKAVDKEDKTKSYEIPFVFTEECDCSTTN